MGKTTLQKIEENGGGSDGGNISPQGRAQMEKLLQYGMSHNAGASNGNCFHYVWTYITADGAGYGKIKNWGDCTGMGARYARYFADFMNVNGNAAKWGLQIIGKQGNCNPYDAPKGAIVVVAPGSPGTSHPEAGDIAVARGNGYFLNDGPYMAYGPKGSYPRSKCLGIYVPK